MTYDRQTELIYRLNVLLQDRDAAIKMLEARIRELEARLAVQESFVAGEPFESMVEAANRAYMFNHDEPAS